MYVDKELLLSDEQAITGSAPSEKVVDFGAAADRFKGKQLYAVVVTDITFTDADASGTLTITAQTHDDASFGVPTTVVATQAYTKASMAEGRDPIIIALPPGVSSEEFFRLYYTVSTGSYDTGKVTAFITDSPQTN
jgi:hypothetical protein